MLRLSLVLFPTLLTTFTPPCVAQPPVLPRGFTVQSLYADGDPLAVFGTRGFAVDPQGDQLYLALETAIYRVDGPGQRVLVHDLGANNDIGLMVRPAGSAEVFYASGSSGALYGRTLASGQLRNFDGPAFAFDLVLTHAGQILVSANPSFPSNPDGGVWLVERGAVPREVARVAGPSGPLLVDRIGNLLYATQSAVFPAPPGSTRVLRFPVAALARAIAGGPLLTEADADTVIAGLDGAFDMAMDDRDRLMISDPSSGTVYRTLPGSFILDTVPLLQVGGSALQLEFHGRGDGVFAAHQPEHGGALHLLTSNFVDGMAVYQAEPLRPTMTSSPTATAGPGPVDFTVQDGPASGMGWLLASFVPDMPELPLYYLDGLPLWIALNPSAQLFSQPLPLDQAGTGTLRLVHPGGFDAEVRFQTVTMGVDPAGTVLWGTSSMYGLRLQR